MAVFKISLDTFLTIRHDASYWILVFFLIIFPSFHNLDTTLCPTTRLSWEKRAKAFTCDTNQSFVYHCILDVSGRPVETCAVRVPVPQGKVGCPRIYISNGVADHMDANSECPTDNDNCPTGNNAYYSDQLYLYPICFWPESERRNYTQENNEDSTERTDTGTTEMAKGISPAAITLGILFAVSLALNVSVLTSLYFDRRRRKKYKKGDASTKSNGTEGDASTKQLNGIGPGGGESSLLNTL